MRRLVLILLALVAIGAGVITAIDLQKPPPPERGGDTRDRLNAERVLRQIKPAMERLQKKDLAGARSAFEAELAKVRARKGQNSLQVADLLSVFGNALSGRGHHDASLPYLRQAVATYRAATGPGSPETAVALSDLAQALYLKDPNAAPPELTAALEEALHIRREALGMNNAETAQAYTHLGQLRGLPVNSRGDPARIEAAAGLIRTALAILAKAPNAEPFDINDARFHLAELYARNGLGGQALSAVEAWAAPEDAYNDSQALELVAHLERAGDPASAQALRDRYEVEAESETAATRPPG